MTLSLLLPLNYFVAEYELHKIHKTHLAMQCWSDAEFVLYHYLSEHLRDHHDLVQSKNMLLVLSVVEGL